jgi:hypothetical protein
MKSQHNALKNAKSSTESTRQKSCSLRSFLDKKDISLNNIEDKTSWG